MTSSSDKSESNPTRDRLAAQESHARSARLEIARRIARETLEADHQALELDAKFSVIIHADRWLAQNGS